MSEIHPTAIVSPEAKLGQNVRIGPFVIIEDDVVIGDGTQIVSSSRIASGARLGSNVHVYHGAVIGTIPQDLKFEGEATLAVIGDNTVIREYATVNRGTRAHGETSIGQGCFLMAYAHVAHDCIIGDNVILANAVNLGGHVEIDEYAIVGGVVPVHQFSKIGTHAMIGGGFRVDRDICPFALMAGTPLRVVSVNAIGLQRRGFDSEAVKIIKSAFKILFFSGLNTTQAVERINSELEATPEIRTILDFLQRSNRGVVK